MKSCKVACYCVEIRDAVFCFENFNLFILIFYFFPWCLLVESRDISGSFNSFSAGSIDSGKDLFLSYSVYLGLGLDCIQNAVRLLKTILVI